MVMISLTPVTKEFIFFVLVDRIRCSLTAAGGYVHAAPAREVATEARRARF